MTHFVGVLVSPGLEPDEDILEKFDENRDATDHVDETRGQIIRRVRREADDFIAASKNPDSWASHASDAQKKRLLDTISMTDDEVFDRELKSWGPGYEDEFDEDGNHHTTYNPDSKWDWYTYGGRFADVYDDSSQGMTTTDYAAEVEKIPVSDDADEDWSGDGPWVPSSIVYRDENGEPRWDEDGPTGWFGFHESNVNPKDWKEHVLSVLREHDGEHVFFIDFHI